MAKRVLRFAGPVGLPVAPVAPLFTVPAGKRRLIRAVSTVNSSVAGGLVVFGVGGVAAGQLVMWFDLNATSEQHHTSGWVLGPGETFWGRQAAGTTVTATISGTEYDDLA